MRYTVQNRQTLMDIALQELGDVAGLVALAQRNNMSITQELQAGNILEIDEGMILKKEVVQYFKSNQIIIVSK